MATVLKGLGFCRKRYQHWGCLKNSRRVAPVPPDPGCTHQDISKTHNGIPSAHTLQRAATHCNALQHTVIPGISSATSECETGVLSHVSSLSAHADTSGCVCSSQMECHSESGSREVHGDISAAVSLIGGGAREQHTLSGGRGEYGVSQEYTGSGVREPKGGGAREQDTGGGVRDKDTEISCAIGRSANASSASSASSDSNHPGTLPCLNSHDRGVQRGVQMLTHGAFAPSSSSEILREEGVDPVLNLKSDTMAVLNPAMVEQVFQVLLCVVLCVCDVVCL